MYAEYKNDKILGQFIRKENYWWLKNIIKQKTASLFTLNIGTFIFGVILLYIVISLVVYATTKHISTYQVISGPLAQNQTYTALALRSENVVTANNDGYIRYYAQNGHKVSKSGAVYSLTQSPSESTGSTELSELRHVS